MMGTGYTSKVSQAPVGLDRVSDWSLKLCWRPQTCFLTGQQLWGQIAYHGVRLITGPGTPVKNHYWVSKNEFLLWRLKQ